MASKPTGRDGRAALNAVCPYFTMFPLDFPLAELRDAGPDEAVLDPFCGRGTTLFAARLSGLRAVGVDLSPVAVAVSRGKVGPASPTAVVALARRILRETAPDPTPEGRFWELAYAPGTLDGILRLRAGLRDRTGPVADALRAIVLGALHGPRALTKAAYLSNQMPRTFAPKPGYLVRFWEGQGMEPAEVDVLAMVAERAARYLSVPVPAPGGQVIHGDARSLDLPARRFSRVITSPPYFGLRTYVPDQWVRDWFLGGRPAPTYVQPGQLGREGNRDTATFTAELAKVWANVAPACRDGARLTIRIGSIRSRPSDPVAIARDSIAAAESGWRIESVVPAAYAGRGQRQADHMGERSRGQGVPAEYDVACVLDRRAPAFPLFGGWLPPADARPKSPALLAGCAEDDGRPAYSGHGAAMHEGGPARSVASGFRRVRVG